MADVTETGRGSFGLALNSTNPVIAGLRHFAGDPNILNAIIHFLHANALLSARVPLSPEIGEHITTSQLRVIELLLEQARRIATGETAGPYAGSKFQVRPAAS